MEEWTRIKPKQGANKLASRVSDRKKKAPASKDVGGSGMATTQSEKPSKKAKSTSTPKPPAEPKTSRSSTPKSAKKVAKSPLNNTVSKMFQQLAAINCYRIVTELTSMKKENLNKAIEQYFHGTESRKTVGQIHQLVEGIGVYTHLWDSSSSSDDKTISTDIVSFLHKLSDISQSMLKPDNPKETTNVLGHATFGKPKKMEGRSIMSKVTAAIRECKKASAYWNSFLVADKFPSGQDEDDLLRLVIIRDTELTQKSSMIALDKESIQLVTTNAAYARLESKMKMNKIIMDDLAAQGKKEWVDVNGVNRYQKAEIMYWETLDKLNDF